VVFTVDFFINTDDVAYAASPYKLETKLKFTFGFTRVAMKPTPAWQLRSMAAEALQTARGMMYSMVRASGNKPVVLPVVREEDVRVE
jgi:hypothetical protein